MAGLEPALTALIRGPALPTELQRRKNPCGRTRTDNQGKSKQLQSLALPVGATHGGVDVSTMYSVNKRLSSL